MSKYFPISASSEPILAWRRASTACVFAELSSGEYASDVISRLWPKDADAIERAVSTPATINGKCAQFAQTTVGAFLKNLRPRSAAAQLFTSPFSLDGRKQIVLPGSSASLPPATFVSELRSIPVMQDNFAGVILGPPGKLAMMTGLSSEVVSYSAEDAVAIVSDLMDEAAARGLDANVFSNAAGSASRPAGLLNGVTAIPSTGARHAIAAMGSPQKSAKGSSKRCSDGRRPASPCEKPDTAGRIASDGPSRSSLAPTTSSDCRSCWLAA